MTNKDTYNNAMFVTIQNIDMKQKYFIKLGSADPDIIKSKLSHLLNSKLI